MRKLLYLLMFISLKCFSQNVAGVSFGMSYNDCKSLLDKKFYNGGSSYQSEKNILSYYDVYFADEHFSQAQFYFQNDGKFTYLHGIFFINRFSLTESKEAKIMRDRLYRLYEKKYDQADTFIDENGYKQYIWGKENDDDIFIIIHIDKAKNREGKLFLWTEINYIGKDFVKPEDDI